MRGFLGSHMVLLCRLGARGFWGCWVTANSELFRDAHDVAVVLGNVPSMVIEDNPFCICHSQPLEYSRSPSRFKIHLKVRH